MWDKVPKKRHPINLLGMIKRKMIKNNPRTDVNNLI